MVYYSQFMLLFSNENSFFGATKTVTGSCFLLEADGHQILVDCGFFQEYDKEYLNYEPFPFNPKN